MKQSIFDSNAGMVGETLEHRRFDAQDQERFAVLSGDRNPIHMDEQAARMTVAGARVVHGVHLVLWALEVLCRRLEVGNVGALNAKFLKFATVDQDLSLHLGSLKTGARRVEVIGDAQVLATLTLKSGIVAKTGPDVQQGKPASGIPKAPLDPSAREMAELDIRLFCPAPASAFATAFPNASAQVGAVRLAGLAVLSSLVGMVCPGQNSIFSQFQAEFTAQAGDQASVHVSSRGYDARFRLVSMAFAGAAMVGEVSAYHRFPPIEASLSAIAALVDPREFADRSALVIGGSRGLGAATAKLIVAGGGRVTITYARNREKAAEIQRELCERYGAGRCQIAHLDAVAVGQSELWDLAERYTHLYYFATPQIAQKGGSVFESAELSGFLDIYVNGFFEVVSALAAKGQPLAVLYPSSIYVEKRPKGMTAYAMAKAAGEILCEDIRRAMPQVSILSPRLPRVLTDQTATVPPVAAPDAAEVILPILRTETSSRS